MLPLAVCGAVLRAWAKLLKGRATMLRRGLVSDLLRLPKSLEHAQQI
jgi:hypothetical protein